MLEKKDILTARILIVDDQASNVQLFEQLLQDSGYTQVTACMRPEEVRALHEKNQYDLILLDLSMPGTDGFEVMEALKTNAADPYMPVIVLTANPAFKQRALQAGAKDFISKPFDLLEVKTRIHNMLEVRLLYKKLALHNQTLEQKVMERTAELAKSEERYRRLTELASDWYWEQNETGELTRVSGPVQEMMGFGMTSFMGDAKGGAAHLGRALQGWDEAQRQQLQKKINAREPFVDFTFSRVNPDGTTQNFRVSGEPIFDTTSRYTGYRGIGTVVR